VKSSSTARTFPKLQFAHFQVSLISPTPEKLDFSRPVDIVARGRDIGTKGIPHALDRSMFASAAGLPRRLRQGCKATLRPSVRLGFVMGCVATPILSSLSWWTGGPVVLAVFFLVIGL
jgi:hypothetical protein